MKYPLLRLLPLFLLLLGFLAVVTGPVYGKSLYVIANIKGSPTPIAAYDIQPSPTYLAFQSSYGVPRWGNGGVGLAIDSDTGTLFVTYESCNIIELINGTTMISMGQTKAPGASNLAGIVVDRAAKKVYTVDRMTDQLYVYDWDSVATNLSLHSQENLHGVSMAHGLAIDEARDLIYVGDLVTKRGEAEPKDNIKVFSTDDWSPVENYTISQSVQGIAVDARNGFVYTGVAYGPYGSQGLLVKLDINPRTETTVDIRQLTNISDDSVVGLAVDTDTGLIYVSTGEQGGGGSDLLMVFDSDLNLLHTTEKIGNPTGIAIPTKDISYNPLDLSVSDGISPGKGISPGGKITYTISFDNLMNEFPVNNVTIHDTLPGETVFTSASNGGTYNSSIHRVTWIIGTLEAGEAKRSITLKVKVRSNTTKGIAIDNAATIDSDDTPPTTKHAYTNVTGMPLGLGSEAVQDVATVGVILVVTYSVGWTAAFGVSKLWLIPQAVEQSTHLLVTRAVTYGITVVGGLVALSEIGVPTAPLVVGLGTGGLALAMGARDIIANMVSGVILMIDRPLKRGDLVEVEGATGEVVDVGLRASTIRTLDNITVLVPNKLIVLNKITNYSKFDPKIRLNIPVGVAYGSDMDKVKGILLSVADGNPGVLKEPVPEVRIVEFGSSSVDLVLFAWIDEPSLRLTIKDEINWEINQQFKSKKITIPFPQMDVWMKKG